MELETIYRAYKSLLFTVAYRILGTVSDSEDMVQDLFSSLQTSDLDGIDNLKGYFVKMIANRCLNFLNSARKKKEVYTGPWLPAPIDRRGAKPDRAGYSGRSRIVRFSCTASTVVSRGEGCFCGLGKR